MLNETLQISSRQKIINSKEVEICEIALDQKLSFHQHIKSICKEVGQKLCVSLGIPLYLEDKKREAICNAIIKFQFNYCPLVWIFCSRKSNNLVNKVQETALRLAYKDNENNFQTLLNEDNETSIL